jgi:hypothetical protein
MQKGSTTRSCYIPIIKVATSVIVLLATVLLALFTSAVSGKVLPSQRQSFLYQLNDTQLVKSFHSASGFPETCAELSLDLKEEDKVVPLHAVETCGGAEVQIH